jgi:sec-independent protein translocase protein TatB
MLDIGMMELFVIGALALIVVGPKDLPSLLRTVGQYVGKARGMARDFQRTMEDAAREADLDDVADVVKSGGRLNKLPFDNQIVDSLKEFQNTVKSETQDAAAAVNAVSSTVAAETEAPAKVEVAVASEPESALANLAKSPIVSVAEKTADTPKTADAPTETKPEKSA